MAAHILCECKCCTRRKHTNRKCHAAKYVCEVVPPEKDRSPERRLCDKCCRLLKNCSCRGPRGGPEGARCCRLKTAEGEGGRPVTLRESLPLYDERCHLLGYVRRGATLDLPVCARSSDPALPPATASAVTGCLPSCSYAAGARRGARGPPAPRWTTRAAFRHATDDSSPARRRCPCD